MDLRQLHMEDMFVPSIGRVWMSRSGSPGKKTHCAVTSPSASDGMERARCK